MTEVPNFVAGLARRGKSTAEIKMTIDTTYGDKVWGLTSIYYILKNVKDGESTDDQHQFSAKKTKQTANITSLAADVAKGTLFNIF